MLGMEVDRNGLEVLSRKDCLALLAEVPVGRIGLSIDALPVVLPVNFCLDAERERIVLRTAPGTKLQAAALGSVVAFQVDDFDAMGHTGWSVLVQGLASVIDDPSEISRLRHMHLRPWANDDTDYWVQISLDLVAGRRVRGWYDASGNYRRVARSRADGA
jgi:nitroimidazol reductase NimA-like FMN-containing flavoprotein (pyridoxamine 5'-phosphate oxidase superfamily)